MLFDVIWDFFCIGLPCFVAGMLTMFAIFVQAKNEQDSKRRDTKKKRISYICYLTDIVLRKRREQQKIDVD